MRKIRRRKISEGERQRLKKLTREMRKEFHRDLERRNKEYPIADEQELNMMIVT